MIATRIGPAARVLGRSLRTHSPRELFTLCEAVLWLGVGRIAVAVLPFRACLRLLGLTSGVGETKVDARSSTHAQVVGARIRSAARQVPWETACLTRVLASAAMLRCRRTPFTIYLGVAGGSSSLESPGSRPIIAHAWLQCDGFVVSGGEEMAEFSVVGSFSTGS